jgi:hypothetical protein
MPLKAELFRGRPAKVDQPPVSRMHLVIDLNDDGPMIVEICHPHPGVHGKGVAGGSQAVLAEDLVREGLSTLELVRIIAGDAELDTIGLLLRPGGGVCVLGICGGRQEQTGEQSFYQDIGFCAK